MVPTAKEIRDAMYGPLVASESRELMPGWMGIRQPATSVIKI
jgi:hypothetical protein